MLPTQSAHAIFYSAYHSCIPCLFCTLDQYSLIEHTACNSLYQAKQDVIKLGNVVASFQAKMPYFNQFR